MSPALSSSDLAVPDAIGAQSLVADLRSAQGLGYKTYMALPSREPPLPPLHSLQGPGTNGHSPVADLHSVQGFGSKGYMALPQRNRRRRLCTSYKALAEGAKLCRRPALCTR